MAGPRRTLLAAWAATVAGLVFLAAHLADYRWNVTLGAALIGLVLFFRVSRLFYPGPAQTGQEPQTSSTPDRPNGSNE